MASLAHKVTRMAFSQLERLAPAASGRLAFKLFCITPSRKPKGRKALEAYQAGRQRLADATITHLALSRGVAAAHHLPQAGGKRFLLVHGWGSRVEYLSALAIGLREAGADVVLLDLPGHGASSGRRLDLRIAAEAIIAAERQFGVFDGVVGHSFGGAAVMMAAGGVFTDVGRLHAGRIALIGSPSSMGDVFGGFARSIGLGPASLAAMRAHVFDLVGCGVEDLDGVPVARAIDRPLLVVHAEDDKEVHVGHAQRYIGVSPHVRHMWANGHGHRRIVSAPDVIATVAAFLIGDQRMPVQGRRATS